MIKCAQASLGTDSIKSLKNTNDFLGVATYELSKRAAGRDDWIYHRTSVLSPNAARASPFWLRLRRAKYFAYSAVCLFVSFVAFVDFCTMFWLRFRRPHLCGA